ncbi:MAG: CPBP family intramembrane metalloprotease [Oscillospiraceae bacterium]|nr:CPBP family intramembrane metalloprotease [Oscillospiraceae bacterium]
MAVLQADIKPVDPTDPFRNPTEEPEYSPDYRAILPEIDKPDAALPLIPSPEEAVSIRKMFSLVFLSLMFGFFTTATVHTALTLGLPMLLRVIDMQREGSLPQNYGQIVQQYFSDSSISMSITLLSCFIGNLSGFWVGCRLTHLSWQDFFKTRRFTLSRMMMYTVIGLWIQLITGEGTQLLSKYLSQFGISIRMEHLAVDGSATRLAVTAVYACLIAPLTEELLFRGILMKNAARVGQRFAIFLSAFFFALAHQNPVQMIFTFPLGIFLGYITMRHNSLTPAILVHILVNTVSVLSALGESNLPASTFRTVSMIYTLSMLAVGTAVFMYLSVTERLPDRTPHQGFRCLRIAGASPLFWGLIIMHIAAALYPFF